MRQKRRYVASPRRFHRTAITGCKTPVLDGMDLKIFGGDRLAILGQSGGGKSTMLRLIAGDFRAETDVEAYVFLPDIFRSSD